MTAKRILSFIIAIFMTSALLAACTSAPEDTQTVRIGGLKGPTSMGLVKLMQDNEDGTSKNRYEFTMAAAADELTPKFIKGELDMIAVPANLASIIYKTTEGGVKLLAINTLGVLYIVEKGESITSVADLKGKTIYATGKGTAPEFGLRHILEENGLDPDKDVTMEWKSEPTEVVALLSNAESGVAMLPQPFVTVAQNSVEGLDIALDLTEQWDAVDSDSRMVTGVLIARKDFVEAHPTLVEAFLKEYKASTDYANTNVDDAAALVEKYNIVKAVIAKKALPYCNIVCITGEEMKSAMKGYLGVLFASAPQSVGGQLPDEDFYYKK